MSVEQRIADLLELAAQEGLVLPLPPEEIANHEVAGHIVDLVTGELITNGAEQRIALSVMLYSASPQKAAEL